MEKLIELYNKYNSDDCDNKREILNNLISENKKFKKYLKNKLNEDYIIRYINKLDAPEWVKEILHKNLKSIPREKDIENEINKWYYRDSEFIWGENYETRFIELALMIFIEECIYIHSDTFLEIDCPVILLGFMSKKVIDTMYHSIEDFEDEFIDEYNLESIFIDILKKVYDIDVSSKEEIVKYRHLYYLDNNELFKVLKPFIDSDPINIMKILGIQEFLKNEKIIQDTY